jgi:hypothetical protein
MNESALLPPKMGRPRKEGVVAPSTVRSRLMRERDELAKHAVNTAQQQLTKIASKELANVVTDKDQKKVADSVHVAMKMIAERTPTIVESMLTKAETDTTAFAILAKWMLPPVRDRINIGEIKNIEQAISKILQGMSDGTIDVQTATQALSAFSSASTVALHSNQIAEIQHLRERTKEVLSSPSKQGSEEVIESLTYKDMIGKHADN